MAAMNLLPFAVAVALVGSTAAAQDSATIDLDGGVTIELSDAWKVDRYINPAMRTPSMRDAMVGASETRLKLGGTGILVSYMEFKTDVPAEPMDADDLPAMEGTTRMAAAQYLRQSVETEVSPRSALVGQLGVTMATLTARDGETFAVRAGYPGGCITSGSIRRGAAVWAISIASESCGSETHHEAVEAMFTAHST